MSIYYRKKITKLIIVTRPYSWFAPNVKAAMLVKRPIANEVFWEFDYFYAFLSLLVLRATTINRPNLLHAVIIREAILSLLGR